MVTTITIANNKLLTDGEAAHALGIEIAMVTQAVKRGHLMPVEVSKRQGNLYRQRDLAVWFMPRQYELRGGVYPETAEDTVGLKPAVPLCYRNDCGRPVRTGGLCARHYAAELRARRKQGQTEA